MYPPRSTSLIIKGLRPYFFVSKISTHAQSNYVAFPRTSTPNQRLLPRRGKSIRVTTTESNPSKHLQDKEIRANQRPPSAMPKAADISVCAKS